MTRLFGFWLTLLIFLGGPVLEGKVRFADFTIAAENAGKGLGNPFKGKSAQEIHDMLIKKGYQPLGPDPLNGKGGYVTNADGVKACFVS